GEGVLGVFVLDELAHFALEHDERGVGTFGTVGAFREERAELKYALRRVRIFVCYSAAYGGRVHPNFLRHFLDHQRPQRLDAFLKELLLAADDDLACAQDGALALGDVAHELHGGAEALLHVLLDFAIGALAAEHLAVAAAEAKAGHVLFVHADHPLAASFHERHVGLDEAGLLAVIEASGPGIEGA